jgi:hypothetical protein
VTEKAPSIYVKTIWQKSNQGSAKQSLTRQLVERGQLNTGKREKPRMERIVFDPAQKKVMRIVLEAQTLKVTGKMILIHQTIFHAKNGSAVERSQ